MNSVFSRLERRHVFVSCRNVLLSARVQTHWLAGLAQKITGHTDSSHASAPKRRSHTYSTVRPFLPSHYLLGGGACS